MRAYADRILGGESAASPAPRRTLTCRRILRPPGRRSVFPLVRSAENPAEALRILKPDASAALLWNERPKGLVPFLGDYEALLRRYAPEYEAVARLRAREEGIRQFFGHPPELAIFPNEQVFDFEGLAGRVMSSSYAPMADRPEHAPLMAGLREVFDRHEREGRVVFPYRTLVYFGQPGRSA